MLRGSNIPPAKGKLGVLIPGMGAVGTTFIAGVELIRRGLGRPIGSVTQMSTIRLGKRTEKRSPMIKDFVPLADLNDIVFGGWDIFEDDGYTAACKAGVLCQNDLDKVRDFLQEIDPMPAVFESSYVKKLKGPNVKKGASKMELAKMLMDDIARFKSDTGANRLVMIWCGSTEIFLQQTEVHQTLAAFEKGLRENHKSIAPSMIYAYAALKSGVPFANGAPNLCVDFPAMWELAKTQNLPIAGKDFKTGQTCIYKVL